MGSEMCIRDRGQVGAVFLPPVVGGDEDLQEDVEDPETAVEILPISPSGSRLSRQSELRAPQPCPCGWPSVYNYLPHAAQISSLVCV